MSDEKTVDLTKEVNFDYPEGFLEALEALDFLPEEMRPQILMGLTSML